MVLNFFSFRDKFQTSKLFKAAYLQHKLKLQQNKTQACIVKHNNIAQEKYENPFNAQLDIVFEF